MIKIIGMYNAFGYAVYDAAKLNTGDPGALLYSAGNARHDSQVYVSPDNDAALPLRTMRSYCIQTAREMAQELKGKYAGTQRDIDSEREKMPPM